MSTRSLRSGARLANVNNENSSNRKVHFNDNIRVSLTKCDKMKLKSKKNVPNSRNLLDNSNSKSVRKTTVNNTSSDEKPSPKKRKSDPKVSSPKVKNPPTKSSQSSPKKRKVENSPKKVFTCKQNNTPDTPTTKSKIPIRNIPKKTKGNKIRQQMKLGRIFIKPSFPLKSTMKKTINSSDKQEKQGQSTKPKREANNNIIVKRLEPRILLPKIDHRNASPRSSVRRVQLETIRRSLRGNR